MERLLSQTFCTKKIIQIGVFAEIILKKISAGRYKRTHSRYAKNHDISIHLQNM
jgi:hypothetical protein